MNKAQGNQSKKILLEGYLGVHGTQPGRQAQGEGSILQGLSKAPHPPPSLGGEGAIRGWPARPRSHEANQVWAADGLWQWALPGPPQPDGCPVSTGPSPQDQDKQE